MGVKDGVSASRRERVRCAIGSLTLGYDGDTCRIGSVFGGVVKFECDIASGFDSTLGSGITLGGGIYLGGGGGGMELYL